MQLAHDVVDGLAEDRAIADQIIGAAAARIERRARHGEDIAALFEREARGDERARAQRRFDDEHAERAARR